MIKTIIAVDAAEWKNMQALTLYFEVPSEDFDLHAAIRDAAKDFCSTETGKQVYSGNRHSFNWGDFAAYIGNEICQKYGFKILESCISEEITNFNHELVDEEDVFPEKEESV